MSHFSLPCIWKMSFLYFVSWVSNYPFIAVERKTLRINIRLLHLFLTLIQVLIHSIHCLETIPLLFLKFQFFSYLDCGFLLLIFVCLFGSNTFIISLFNFSECTVFLSVLSKRSYHFFSPRDLLSRISMPWPGPGHVLEVPLCMTSSWHNPSRLSWLIPTVC